MMKMMIFQIKKMKKKENSIYGFVVVLLRKRKKYEEKKRRRKENFVSKFKFDFSFKYFQSALKDLSFCFVLPR